MCFSGLCRKPCAHRSFLIHAIVKQNGQCNLMIKGKHTEKMNMKIFSNSLKGAVIDTIFHFLVVALDFLSKLYFFGSIFCIYPTSSALLSSLDIFISPLLESWKRCIIFELFQLGGYCALCSRTRTSLPYRKSGLTSPLCVQK